MKINFTQPWSSSAVTNNPLVAAFLYSGEMKWLVEVMLIEEEVLTQIAWDICRGFRNIKADTWILCKTWEQHLETLGSGDAYRKQSGVQGDQLLCGRGDICGSVRSRAFWARLNHCQHVMISPWCHMQAVGRCRSGFRALLSHVASQGPSWRGRLGRWGKLQICSSLS